MLDINLIRKEPDKIKEGAQKKNVDPKLVDKFLRIDCEWRNKLFVLDELKKEQNIVSKELATSRTEAAISKAQLLKDRISDISQEEKELSKKRLDLLSKIPNVPFSDVPVAENENFNKIIREEGKKPKFDFEPKDYFELAEKKKIIDVKKAADVVGSRFGYLVGDAALMEFALINLALEIAVPLGFEPIIPPVLVRPGVMRKMGKGKFIDEKDAFYIEEDDFYLIASSEHVIGPFHMNDIFEKKELPKRYVGFSTCFRREAGSYGRDTRGILRVHQFDKVELFSFAEPKNSQKELDFLISVQEVLMKKIKLHYRVVEICTGDMGFSDARQFDIETWFPSEEKYRETHSASNTTDFQARGTNVRYRDKSKTEFIHMLNATAFAIGRTTAAIIENHQTKNGKIKVPIALKKYLKKSEI